MKLKRKFFGRILASLMLLAISLPWSFNMSAKLNYRGFAEGGLGISFIDYQYDGTLGRFRGENTGQGVAFGYMVSSTHGIQIKNNFIGLGIGITSGYCAAGDFHTKMLSETYDMVSSARISKISIPIYFNWRYDFFNIRRTLKPYIGVKAGVFLPITKYTIKYEYRNSEATSFNYIGSDDIYGFPLYAAIEFGLRKRLSESSGVSFGLCVQTSNDAHKDMEGYWTHNNGYHNSDWHEYELKNNCGFNVLAKFAFDF